MDRLRARAHREKVGSESLGCLDVLATLHARRKRHISPLLSWSKNLRILRQMSENGVCGEVAVGNAPVGALGKGPPHQVIELGVPNLVQAMEASK